jgi:outer membrane protein TolC
MTMGGGPPCTGLLLRASRSGSLIPAALIVLCVSSGCPSFHVADADREVARVLREYQSRTLGSRASSIRQPEPAKAPPESQPATATQPASTPAGEVLVLDLAGALEIAFTSSRDFLDQKESLYLSGLGFTLTRHDFGPLLNSTISYLWNDAEQQIGGDSLNASLSGSQIMPTGGNVTVSGSLSGARENDRLPLATQRRDFRYDSTVGVSLRQPLLRGAGYEVSHEALTQGERNLVYAVRSFELFREDFSIRVADAFFQLVSQKQRLANDEQNYLDAVYDRRKAEALRAVDRNQDDDVFLARRREIEAEDALLVSRTAYKLAQDEFKLLLGRPTETEIRISDDEPEFAPVRIDPQSAVAAAQHNRLDLQTERDQLEDVERNVRLAKNGLLPDLDLSFDYSQASRVGDEDDATPSRWSSSMGLTLEVPVDRKAERNAYRSALIALDRARRDYQLRLDEIARDILDQLRELEQNEKRIQLQKDQIEFEKRAVAVMQIRVESGDADNRDLSDARQGLQNAQNALIDLKVRHFIARLRLRRNLGILFIDEKGMWQL